jgi:hypothetical protein
MMKKKTVITTETREVWVIHRPSDEAQVREAEQHEAERDADPLPALRDQKPHENESFGQEK